MFEKDQEPAFSSFFQNVSYLLQLSKSEPPNNILRDPQHLKQHSNKNPHLYLLRHRVSLSMALARLALKKHLQQRVLSPSSLYAPSVILGRGADEKTLVKRFTTEATDKVVHDERKRTEDKEVTVSEGRRKRSSLFPSWKSSKGLWSRNDSDFVPSLSGTLFHSFSTILYIFRPVSA